ncbi:unnamed protein product [Hermetia illucens]|uniref:Transcriptional regulator ATRX n=1 Tax=Hermetia illucens TaxID=343691 RepID=A0A7R8UFG4_HERIL|nr:unnamed protein product [Hermetia illucens]
MRETCGSKTTYPEPPPPPAALISISNMLNDEAPDNFLSSAALEKNIFSDDDEYGLNRLKKSDRNFDKPTWEIEFNTDDLIRKESDLGLDLVNFPPPPPAPPPTLKMSEHIQENRINSNRNINDKQHDSEADLDDQPEILYEISTDGSILTKDKENANTICLDNDCIEFVNDSPSSIYEENENDNEGLQALSDHNYTTPTIKFEDVTQFIRDHMTATEKSCILDLLASQTRDNCRLSSKKDDDRYSYEDMDDDQFSNASTECFPYTANENLNCNEGGSSNIQEVRTSEREFGETSSPKTICKEELILEEQMASQVSIRMTTEPEEKDCDTNGNIREGNRMDVDVSQPDDNELENNTPNENIVKSSELVKTKKEQPELSETLGKPSSEDTPTEDVPRHSDQTEQVNEKSVTSTEINDSDHGASVIKKEKEEDRNSDQTKEKEIAPEEVGENLPPSGALPKKVGDIVTNQSDATKSDGVEHETNSSTSEPEDPKILELKTFANRLLNFCSGGYKDKNFDAAMEEIFADFRSIVRPSYVDKEIQTEKLYSKEKRTKMNEKAKKRLLNAISSSDYSSSSDEEYEEEYSTSIHPNVEPTDEAGDIPGDEDKLEKSPSYSDLSCRASSEEFLPTEADERYQRSVIDDIDLSNYAVPSPGKTISQESDGLDLSKYEVASENSTEKSKVESSEHDKDDDGDVDMNGATLNDDNIQETSVDKEVVDEEMQEVTEENGKGVQIAEDGDTNVKDEDEQVGERREMMEEILEKDEKLRSEVVVVVNKMSDEDLEEYYDDLRDKEITKLLRYSGLIKPKTDSVQSSSDKPAQPIKSKNTKKLLEILKEAENDICSDETNSDVEEATMTEKDFLKLCNQKAKDYFLKSSSSDSEVDAKMSDIDDLDVGSDYISSEEEGPIVEKFLEKFSKIVENETVPEASSKEPESTSNEPDKAPNESENTGIDLESSPNKPEESKAEDKQPNDDRGDREDTNGENNTKEVEDKAEKATGDKILFDYAKSGVANEAIHLDSTDDLSMDGLSDEVIEVNTGDKEKKSIEVEGGKEIVENGSVSTPRPSTSRGMLSSIRNLLMDDKEIDIEAIEKGTAGMSNDDEEASFDKSLSRRPASSKSLETLIEESRRRQNNKSADNTVVTLDSDSDLEEISAEPDLPKRSIKPMLRKDQLAGETRMAQRRENERIKRLEKKNELLSKAIEEYKEDLRMTGSQEKELILDFHSETKTFIKIDPDIVKHLKAHQVDGIKFMYDNTYGMVDHLKKYRGSGCILAHCMGLGKTLQIVALLHTVINYKELDTSKILVLCPKSTVMNWADEIRRWLGPQKCSNLKIFSFSDTSSSIEEKLKILHEWSHSGKPGFRKAGCLLLGYEAFRMLVFNPLHKKKIVSQAQSDRIKQKIRDTLLEPGADLVICDEGHIIKNRKSATSLAVSEISTPRRIILTGTPIQNNLKEYYAMVNFIKPKFLGTEKEFANLYENPIRNGQHKDSNKRDIKIMKQRSFVLHKKLSKFVQRREAALLKTFLPMKFEYVLFIPMTDVQIRLYDYFMEVSSKREGSKGKNLIPDYTCLRKIWTHPRVLENAWKNAMLKKRDNKKSPLREPNSDDEVPDDVYDTQTGALSVTDDWWRSLLSEDNLKSILPSSKLQVMFEILRMCGEHGEKCLIFSAFVAVLDCVEYFMHEISNQGEDAAQYGLTKYRGPWESGKDYYRLDGKTPKNIRHEMIRRFNDPKMTRARVFLISAKAGGQGINLIGANRVIILDTSWNPSNDQQNIFRVFRLGQKRQCYVYRLLAMGTMEEKVYSRSVTKQAMSFRVVDEQQIDRHYSMAELSELYTLTKPDFQNRPVPPLPQDSILASLLRNSPNLVYKYHEHDSLLENKLEQELSEQEKADAWDAYEKDLQSSQNPDFLSGMNSMPALYPNPGFMPPGMGFGFHPDRNYPMGYAPPLSQSYLSPMGFGGNSSLLDMLKMFSPPPPTNPSLMSALNASNPGSAQGNTNMLQSYGPGVLPPNSASSNSLPMNLPPFSTLQSMVASTGMNSLSSFTPPYSSIANSYNVGSDQALYRLSQMYASSMGASSIQPLDGRSPPGRPSTSSPSISSADKRNSPFPTGLLPPATASESIPTSVIIPPQAHSASTSRHSAQTPSLAQQFASHPVPNSYLKAGVSGNSDLPSLQQQLMAQSRLPPPNVQPQALQSLLQNHIASPRNPDSPRPQGEISTSKSHITSTSVASALPSSIASLTAKGTNRNSSPITVSSQNSPKLKAPGTAPVQRATNMGIVYPPENSPATITPIISTVVSQPNTSISVRSVSSINSSSSKSIIPATIISKPGANISSNFSLLSKPNSSSETNNALSTNSSVTVSAVGKQSNVPSLAKATLNITDKPQVSSSSLLPPLWPPNTSQRQDKSRMNPVGVNVDKSAMQILGSNNVQLTKVPNNKPVVAKPTSNPGKQQFHTTGTSKSQAPSIHSKQGTVSSVITKARPNSGVTVLSVPSGLSGNNVKSLQSSSANVVPTLVPLSPKTNVTSSTRSIAAVPNKNPNTTSLKISNVTPSSLGAMNAKTANSLSTVVKKPNSLGRSTALITKPTQPTLNTSSVITGPVKRAVSMTNLPSAKQSRPPMPQISRQTSSLGIQQSQHTRPPPSSVPGKQQHNVSIPLSGRVNSNNSKNSLSIRSIDAINNKFANAGITISSGKSKGNVTNQNVLTNVMNQGNSSIKNVNSASSGSLNNLSSVTLSKVGTGARKRSSTNFSPINLPVSQLKKPRMGQSTERNVEESLLRARSNQGLTILLKNSQGNQKPNKDGKVTDVVEID